MKEQQISAVISNVLFTEKIIKVIVLGTFLLLKNVEIIKQKAR